MQSRPFAAMLDDGRRLHLQHGPIDLIIEAMGSEADVRRVYDQARAAFEPVLNDLVAEMALLRRPVGDAPTGEIARAMWRAVRPFGDEFITPMAAVAGSVADYMLQAMTAGISLDRAYVNNGGDIALFVNEGTFRIGICDVPMIGRVGGTVEIKPGDGIGGIATSGWRGRSFSFGIADAVTILASSAAAADAAATMVANKVDLPGSQKIMRNAAQELQPDSDLGDRLVTTNVLALEPAEAKSALQRGIDAATGYFARGLFRAAYLALDGNRITVPDDDRLDEPQERNTHG